MGYNVSFSNDTKTQLGEYSVSVHHVDRLLSSKPDDVSCAPVLRSLNDDEDRRLGNTVATHVEGLGAVDTTPFRTP
jgi:hypothetical protein